MNILVLETDAPTFFSTAQKLEDTCPEGIWRYCKFINKNQVLGIFESEQSLEGCLKIHPDFFKHFLGLFSPSLEESFQLNQEKTFQDFCIKLNSLLNEGSDIYDLSVTQKWIWSKGADLMIPKKLKSFLNFE